MTRGGITSMTRSARRFVLVSDRSESLWRRRFRSERCRKLLTSPLPAATPTFSTRTGTALKTCTERFGSPDMTGDEVKAIRQDIGRALGQRVSCRDLALALGIAPQNAKDTGRRWETDGPTGPVATALD